MHSNRHFALSVPPPTDPRLAPTLQHLHSTLQEAAMRLRSEYASQHHISIFDTEVSFTPDPNRPNIITLTVRSRVETPGGSDA